MGYSMKGNPKDNGSIEGTSGHKKAVEEASIAKQNMWDYDFGDTKEKDIIKEQEKKRKQEEKDQIDTTKARSQEESIPESQQPVAIDPGKDRSKMHKGQIRKQKRLDNITKRRKKKGKEGLTSRQIELQRRIDQTPEEFAAERKKKRLEMTAMILSGMADIGNKGESNYLDKTLHLMGKNTLSASNRKRRFSNKNVDPNISSKTKGEEPKGTTPPTAEGTTPEGTPPEGTVKGFVPTVEKLDYQGTGMTESDLAKLNYEDYLGKMQQSGTPESKKQWSEWRKDAITYGQ